MSIEMKIQLEVGIYVGSVAYENLLCSGIYESSNGGQEVSITNREIGDAGRDAILSDYDVNTVIEAALEENEVDYSADAVYFIIGCSVEDIANNVISPEEAGYSAKLVE